MFRTYRATWPRGLALGEPTVQGHVCRLPMTMALVSHENNMLRRYVGAEWAAKAYKRAVPRELI